MKHITFAKEAKAATPSAPNLSKEPEKFILSKKSVEVFKEERETFKLINQNALDDADKATAALVEEPTHPAASALAQKPGFPTFKKEEISSTSSSDDEDVELYGNGSRPQPITSSQPQKSSDTEDLSHRAPATTFMRRGYSTSALDTPATPISTIMLPYDPNEWDELLLPTTPASHKKLNTIVTPVAAESKSPENWTEDFIFPSTPPRTPSPPPAPNHSQRFKAPAAKYAESVGSQARFPSTPPHSPSRTFSGDIKDLAASITRPESTLLRERTPSPIPGGRERQP